MMVPAGRRPTLADVAARAGVSVALVSIVLRNAPGASQANRDRVVAAAADIGYRPDRQAQLLRSSRSRLLGAVFDVHSAFHGGLVAALYQAAEQAGMRLALSATTPGHGEKAAIDDLLDDRCEALILLGPRTPTARLADLSQRVPLIVLARAVRHRDIEVVRTDDTAGIRLAVEHLVRLGHRRIAHIDGARAPGAADRRRGYRHAMHDHELDIDIIPGGLTEDDGAAAARILVSRRDLPTAVAVFNDRCATGVLNVFNGAGISVPEHLSVVGYDNSHLAALSFVDLTTIAQDTNRLASLAVAKAVDRTGRTPADRRESIVPPELVVRRTTAPPRVLPQPGRAHTAASPRPSR